MNFLHHTKPVIIIGFGIILTIMAMLTAIWLVHIDANNKRLLGLVNEQQESELIFVMRDAAHKRALALYRMAILEDPFDLDEEYIHFGEQAERFIKARDLLLARSMSVEERSAWEVAQPLIQEGSASQSRTVRLILEDRIEEANQQLLHNVIPIQNAVMEHLTLMLDLQKGIAAAELEETSRQNNAVFVTVASLGGMALLIGALIALFVIKTSTRSERELVRTREDAQQANQHKSLFLANMSHELRTPLNAIIGYSEMLKEEVLDLGHGTIAADLSKINGAGHHLLALINDILDISKIEAGKMDLYPEPFDLSSLIDEVAYTIQPLLERNHNKMTISLGEVSDLICNDLVKLRQLLFNLLSNACKFTNNGVIDVTVSECEIDRGTWIKIAIKDTGIGITQEQMKKIFAPFTQADASTTRNYGGTGLGLAISKRFCELMGGSLGVESEPGKGATFTITLPKRVDGEPVNGLKCCA